MGPYTDAGASCSDVIDGTVTTHCSSDNAAWDASKGCSGLVDVSITGVYNIVYTAQNTVGLWNNGANCRGGASTYGRKVTVSDTLRPVSTLLRVLPATWWPPSSRTTTLSRRSWPRRPPRRSTAGCLAPSLRRSPALPCWVTARAAPRSPPACRSKLNLHDLRACVA